MKKSYLLYVSLVCVACLAFYCKQPVAQAKQQASGDGGIAIIELFTSEGCSSCPPADALIEKLVNEQHSDILVLAYHVDYWDRLGWKDPFSQHIFSERQQQYAASFKLNGVYTPQVVVNGKQEFVGSNENKLRTAIKQKVIDHQIKITSSQNNENLNVQYTYDGPLSNTLNFVIIQNKATTNVTRGENGGRQLSHVNIVRSLKTIQANKSGTASIEIPKDLHNGTFSLIAFSQNKSDRSITSAARIAM